MLDRGGRTLRVLSLSTGSGNRIYRIEYGTTVNRIWTTVNMCDQGTISILAITEYFGTLWDYLGRNKYEQEKTTKDQALEKVNLERRRSQQQKMKRKKPKN